MISFNSYLHFNGNAEEAFNFYKSVFGGEFITIMRLSDVPPEIPMPSREGKQILHVSLAINKDTILLGSDVPDSVPQAVMGTNFHISINVTSQEEADRLFQSLASGGNITMPIGKQFWGAYFGMVRDQFGVNWMVSYEYKKM